MKPIHLLFDFAAFLLTLSGTVIVIFWLTGLLQRVKEMPYRHVMVMDVADSVIIIIGAIIAGVGINAYMSKLLQLGQKQ